MSPSPLSLWRRRRSRRHGDPRRGVCQRGTLTRLPAVVSAGAGFLLAVLWFDLMFDVQVLRHRTGELPEAVLASIAGYYRRVTTDASPMSRLVLAAMLATVGGVIAEVVRHEGSAWPGWASLGLATAPILLAGGHTVPRAVRLGARTDPLAEQSALARSVCRDHLFCFGAIAILLVVQLTAAH